MHISRAAKEEFKLIEKYEKNTLNIKKEQFFNYA